jgi:CRISPR-associated protein Cmr3
MTWLFVQPSDVWFFRDGRPYAAGQGQTAGSIFPPAPLTVQGAIRSLILGHSNVGWSDFRHQSTQEARALGERIGYPARMNDEGSVVASLAAFSMQGPLVGRLHTYEDQVEWLAPMPQDAYVVDDGESQSDLQTWRALQPARVDRETGGWTEWPENLPLQPLLPPTKYTADEPEGPGWLTPAALTSYLQGQGFRALSEPLFEREPRLGIAIDYDRNRPRQGMIYQPEFYRPAARSLNAAQPGLLVKLGDGVKLPAMEGTLVLGGESRAAHYCVLPTDSEPPAIPQAGPTTRLKLVLLTPAWFNGGWQPVDGNWSRWFGGQRNLRLVAAAVGRPLHIGGWDVARKGHKPMRACVPAGSVYYFEAKETLAAPGAFTDTPPESPSFSGQGFGVVASWRWQWLDQEYVGG